MYWLNITIISGRNPAILLSLDISPLASQCRLQVTCSHYQSILHSNIQRLWVSPSPISNFFFSNFWEGNPGLVSVLIQNCLNLLHFALNIKLIADCTYSQFFFHYSYIPCDLSQNFISDAIFNSFLIFLDFCFVIHLFNYCNKIQKTKKFLGVYRKKSFNKSFIIES